MAFVWNLTMCQDKGTLALVDASVRVGVDLPIPEVLDAPDPATALALDPDLLLLRRHLRARRSAVTIVAQLDSADEQTVVLTCDTLQNLCHEPEWARAILRHGAPRRLGRLPA